MHTPQSMQASVLTCAFPSSIEMASLGHSSTQDSQPVHFSLSIFAGITQPFPKTTKLIRIKIITFETDEMLHNHNRNTKQIFLNFFWALGIDFWGPWAVLPRGGVGFGPEQVEKRGFQRLVWFGDFCAKGDGHIADELAIIILCGVVEDL